MNFVRHARIPQGIATVVIVASHLPETGAQAALTYTTLNSLSVASTLTSTNGPYPGSIGNWFVSLTSEPITDSRSVDSRDWFGSSPQATTWTHPSGGVSSYLSLTTAGISQPSGPIDFIKITHTTPYHVTSWNCSGSVNVTFDRSIDFYYSPRMGEIWSYGGNTIAAGTRFNPGTYTFGFGSTFSIAAPGTLSWVATAYFQPVAVPAPAAVALLGLAGLRGRRRQG